MTDDVTPENLAAIEADWSPHFMEAGDIAPWFGRALRQAWDERDKLKEELRKVQESHKIIPMDVLERKALKEEIEYSRNKYIELEKETNVVYGKLEVMTKQYEDLKTNMGLPGDELLETYLHALEDKFKVRFDEAFDLRIDDKISEYAMTGLTLAYQLVYSARAAWKSAMVQCGGIIDQPKKQLFEVQTKIEEAKPVTLLISDPKEGEDMKPVTLYFEPKEAAVKEEPSET